MQLRKIAWGGVGQNKNKKRNHQSNVCFGCHLLEIRTVSLLRPTEEQNDAHGIEPLFGWVHSTDENGEHAIGKKVKIETGGMSNVGEGQTNET